MFDDPDIKDELAKLKMDLMNDVSCQNLAFDKEEYDYPVIRNRYDDIDYESIPHHWSSINPLLYHLLIWALIKNSILELTDEDSTIQHQAMKAAHRKNLIKIDIDKFKLKQMSIESQQDKLLEFKVDLQKVTEKCLAYFRQKKRSRKYSYHDVNVVKEIFKVASSLYK